MNELRDSGKREIYPTGMIREPNDGRGRYDLISPIALKALAIHYERGSNKYEDRNWERGTQVSKHLNSALRHLQSYLEGDREEDHLSACVFNCFAITHVMKMIDRGVLPKDLNDLPNFMGGINSGSIDSSTEIHADVRDDSVRRYDDKT
jgi:hypothetical protein